MELIHKKIEDLIGENLIFASVLYYFGIKFYEYSDKTLKQVCLEKKLDINTVIKRLESVGKGYDIEHLKLGSYPIDLIIEYLKHTHFIFIKQKLPFIARLIEGIKMSDNLGFAFIDDLKLVFPLFVEDFIQHIYYEEDTLFNYILSLNKALTGKSNPSALYYDMEKHSIQKYALDHDLHDDEMQGIREITQNYAISDNCELQVRVLIAELESFERDLIIHANVENEVLFPKALSLEREVKAKFAEKIGMN